MLGKQKFCNLKQKEKKTKELKNMANDHPRPMMLQQRLRTCTHVAWGPETK